MPSQIDIGIEVPPLPEGWSGSPDDLIEFIKENAIFTFDGDFPTGQIGGAIPTEDVGVYYGPTSIETFRDGAYRPISDVPVGCLLPFASTSPTVPPNYLLCDGRSLTRADYADLFAVIGVTWGSESPTTFNLPDMRGRIPVGSGIGDYAKQGVTGRMLEVTAGTYTGFEWPYRKTLFPNSPVLIMRDYPTIPPSQQSGAYLSVTNPSAGMPWIIRYR